MITTSDKQYSLYTNFNKQEVQSENMTYIVVYCRIVYQYSIVVQLVTQARVKYMKTSRLKLDPQK